MYDKLLINLILKKIKENVSFSFDMEFDIKKSEKN